MKNWRAFRAWALLPALSISLIAAAPSSSTLPSSLVVDVHESYRLLSTTFYKKLDAQTLLDGARLGMNDALRKHGQRADVPQIHAASSDDDTIDALDAQIAQAVNASHANASDLVYAAIQGMAKSANDRYTTFLTPDEFRAFNNALDPEKVSGIGVLIEPDPISSFIRTTYVVPSTPAERAGLHPGDVIQSVDGVTTKGLSVEDASKLLRGKAGTLAHVLVARTGTESHDYAITRSEIQPPTVVYRMLPGDIAYIYVIAFGRATPNEFDLALSRIKDAGARAVVLDLRNNGGGYVDSALEISSRFIAKKALLTVQQRGVPETTYDAQNDARISVPVTVLVNQYTASASEITAGALQDDGIGILVGTRTFGKGVMQSLVPLADGAAIKITTAHYLTPRRRDINLRGIDPDVRIDENRDARFGDADKDAQLRAALAFLQKKIADVKP